MKKVSSYYLRSPFNHFIPTPEEYLHLSRTIFLAPSLKILEETVTEFNGNGVGNTAISRIAMNEKGRFQAGLAIFFGIPTKRVCINNQEFLAINVIGDNEEETGIIVYSFIHAKGDSVRLKILDS